MLRSRSSPPFIVDGWIDCGGGLVYPLLDGFLALREDAVVSLPPTGVETLEPAVAAAVNDELASLPAALAVVPSATPDAAAHEIVRARSLGLAGAQLMSNAGGRPLGADEPLFAAAGDFPLVLHPTLPVDRAYVADHGMLSTVGFLFDTTACAVRLVAGGLFDRVPDARVLLPHAGSTIPFLFGRFDYEAELLGLPPYGEALRLLYTDSLAATGAALRMAVDVFGADRVLFGSDAPFWSYERAVSVLDAAQLSAEERAMLERGNAARLFGVS